MNPGGPRLQFPRGARATYPSSSRPTHSAAVQPELGRINQTFPAGAHQERGLSPFGTASHSPIVGLQLPTTSSTSTSSSSESLQSTSTSRSAPLGGRSQGDPTDVASRASQGSPKGQSYEWFATSRDRNAH